MSDLERRLEDLYMADSRARRVEQVNVAPRGRSPFAPLAFVGGVAALTLAVIVTLSLLRGGEPAPASSPTPATSAAAVAGASPSASATLGEQVMCGRVSQFSEATATEAGRFVITPQGQSGSPIVIRPGTQAAGVTGYVCVRVDVALAAPSVSFVALLAPGMAGYVAEGANPSSAPSPTIARGVKPDAQHGVISSGGNASKLRTEIDPAARATFGLFRGLAVTKDGKRVAYVRVGDTSAQLIVFDTANPDAQKTVIDFPGGVETPGGLVWSVDSNDELLIQVDKRSQSQPLAVDSSSLRAVNVDTGASREIARTTNALLLPIAWHGSTNTGAAVETGDGGFAGTYDYISGGTVKRSPLPAQTGAFAIRADAAGARILSLGAMVAARGVTWWPIDHPEDRHELKTADGWDVSTAYWRPDMDEIVVFASPTVKGAPSPAPRIEAWTTAGQRRVIAEGAGPLGTVRVDGTAAITTSWNLVDLTTGAVTPIPGVDRTQTPSFAVKF